jgi:hypothetical protein
VTWTYQISTGSLTDPNGGLVGYGYSGNGADLDNPAGEGDIGHGPIPEGLWNIGPFFDDPGGKGPVVCHLFPQPGNTMDGRDGGFMIHGDNAAQNHTASDGCVILSHPLRLLIDQSIDRTLEVVA